MVIHTNVQLVFAPDITEYLWNFSLRDSWHFAAKSPVPKIRMITDSQPVRWSAVLNAVPPIEPDIKICRVWA